MANASVLLVRLLLMPCMSRESQLPMMFKPGPLLLFRGVFWGSHLLCQTCIKHQERCGTHL